MTTLFEVKKDIYENDLKEEGRQEGKTEELVNVIAKLMVKKNYSFEEACDFLDIVPQEYPLYYEGVIKLNKK